KDKASDVKRTRASLTGAQKQEVCQKKLQKPAPKNKELAKEFGVSEGMIFVGKKRSKERATIAICCNATGTEKAKAIFIEKSQNPRALKNIPKSTLPVQYYWNKTAYMQ
ncbi:1169_t:CDS:2, partial [Funneliformis mosseae]